MLELKIYFLSDYYFSLYSFSKRAIFQLYHGENNLYFDDAYSDTDDVRFVLEQHALLIFYSADSLKQQSAVRHVAPFKHIILTPSQKVFALTP